MQIISFGKKQAQKAFKKNPLLLLSIIGALLLFIILSIVFKLYLYTQKKLTTLQTNSIQAPTPSAQEIKRLIAKLEKHIVLPSEEPKFITLQNVEALKEEQKFFTSAKDGDWLFIYSNKVILYDPVKDKVIDVAQIRITPSLETTGSAESSINTPTATISPSPKPSEAKVKITNLVLYNGTQTEGLTFNTEAQILTKSDRYKIIDKDYAQKRDYPNTLVIDLTGGGKEAAQDLAQVVKGEISTLPAGEIKPEGADILVIVGKDKE